MSIRIAFVGLAIAAIGSAAWAQVPSPSPELSTREISNARAQADRIIARGEAAAYFENITDSAMATIRHRPSGMTCAFPRETAFDFVRLFPSQPGGPREGDDAMCNIRTPDMDLSTYATRYRRPLSPTSVMQDAQRAIEQRFADARPYEGALASAAVGDWPAPLITAYHITVEAKPRLTYVLVSHRGDWSFKGRATGQTTERDAMALNLLVSLRFLEALPASPP